MDEVRATLIGILGGLALLAVFLFGCLHLANSNNERKTDIQKAFIVACTHADNVDACLAKIK